MLQLPWERKRIFFVLLLVLLSLCYLLPRMFYLPRQKMGEDQQRAYRLALEHARGEVFHYYGSRVFTVGYHMPVPGYFSILSLPLQLHPSPLALRWFILVLNWAGAGLLFFLVRRMFGTLSAVVTFLLVSFSPWLVKYSIFIWNPNFLPFFAALSLLLLQGCLEKSRSWLLLPLIAVLYLALGFHPTVAALWLLAGAACLVYRVRVNRAALFLGLGLVLLGTLIYVCNDAAQGWRNSRVLGSTSTGPLFRPEALKVVQYMFLMPSCEVSHFIGRSFSKVIGFYQASGLPVPIHFVFLIASVSLSFYSLFWYLRTEWIKKRGRRWREYFAENQASSLILLWFFSIFVFMLLVRQAFVPRYALVALYAAFVMLAQGLVHLYQKLVRRPWLRRGYVLFLGLLAAYQLFLSYHLELVSR